MRLPNIDLYSQKNIYQIFIGINVALIGIGSLFYTYNITNSLDKKERYSVQLSSRMQEYLANHPDADEELTTLISIVQENNIKSGIPQIFVSDGQPAAEINMDIPRNVDLKERQRLLNEAFEKIKNDHPPQRINVAGSTQYIYYGDSPLLRQMRYYPYVQLLSVLVLASLAYLVFSASRAAEQNRVWVGLAKETAHQLGTPIASLMGWVEFFRTDPERYPAEYVVEIEKDTHRLEMITARFSSIGSTPTLKYENLNDIVGPFLDYLRKRISTKVTIELSNLVPVEREVYVNRYLFEWVIENICKNAVDSMGGIGQIFVTIKPLNAQEITIDIADTGKGIARSHWKKVFRPGFSTKKRGWGLGLTLAKRIIEEYHQGKLFVKASENTKGATFRILLKK
jgi:signal transduction histidine kinase